MKRIYLDHAATTPARPEAIAAMLPVLGEGGYNPSSVHSEGRAARAVLDDARDTFARLLGARPREIVFTGSGSESIGLAIAGAARARSGAGRHVITSAIEHHAVLQSLEALERDGWEITRLDVDTDGRIDVDAFAAAIRPDTTLATIMLANNEIGTIAPIAKLAAIARRAGVLFHTDAVQAPYLLDVDVRALGVDLLSISAHKFYGPKGVGALFVRSGTPIAAQIVGGGQEHGLRAGTENVAGIAGAAAALTRVAAERAANVARITALRDRFEAAVLAAVPDVRINAAGAPRLPGISSMAFADAAADALLIRLDLAGVAASAGSACAAGSLEPSHVASAIGLPSRWASGVIRFSLGHMTTADDIARVVELLPRIIRELRHAAAVV